LIWYLQQQGERRRNRDTNSGHFGEDGGGDGPAAGTQDPGGQQRPQRGRAPDPCPPEPAGQGGSHGGREGRPCPDQWEEGGGRGALTAARKQPAQPRDDHTEGTEVRRVTAAVARRPRTPATMTATATLRGAARVAVPSPAWGKEAPRRAEARARERTQGSGLPASRGTGSRRERSGSSRGGEM